MLVFKMVSDLNGGGEGGGGGILDRRILVGGTVSMAQKSVASKDGSRVIGSGLSSLLNGDKDAASASNWTSLSNSSLSCCILSNEFFIENKCVVSDDLFGFLGVMGEIEFIILSKEGGQEYSVETCSDLDKCVA